MPAIGCPDCPTPIPLSGGFQEESCHSSRLRDPLLQRARMAAYRDTCLLPCAVTLSALLPALLSQASRKSSTMHIK
jgi:hypothetical protein